MANSFDGLAALKREEALELATDLMVKDPAGMGNADVLFAAKMSSLGDYSQALDANSDDLTYLIAAGENFYNQATQEQKDTRIFAECARMLAVAYKQAHVDQSKVVYYQECAARCLEVKEKLDPVLGDALVSFDLLLEQDIHFSKLQSMAEAGLAGAKPDSARSARWKNLTALTRWHAGDLEAAEQYYQTAALDNAGDHALIRLQTELKAFERDLRGAFFHGCELFSHQDSRVCL